MFNSSKHLNFLIFRKFHKTFFSQAFPAVRYNINCCVVCLYTDFFLFSSRHELTVVLEKAYQGNHWSVLLSGDSSSGELPLSGDMLGLTAKEMEQLKHRIDMIHSTNTGEENSSKRVWKLYNVYVLKKHYTSVLYG